MKRNRRLFSAYEMELLARNPYTYRVRARQLLFTAEFKRRFWEQYERGGDVQQIFENMGTIRWLSGTPVCTAFRRT